MNLVQQLREKVLSGKPVFGTMLNELKAPGVIQILANSGFDFVIIDSEHGTYTIEQMCTLIASAHATMIPAIVRIPLRDRAIITQVLDVGADGIMFPQSFSMEDVCSAVELTKYPPIGCRGVHMFRPHTQFNPPADSFEYMKKANSTLITAIQIETLQASSIVDKIAATEGVDMVYIGPTDLKTNLHFYKDNNIDEKLKQISIQTVQACHKHSKIAGYHCAVEDIPQLCSLGFNVFGYAAASRLLASGAKDFIEQARNKMRK